MENIQKLIDQENFEEARKLLYAMEKDCVNAEVFYLLAKANPTNIYEQIRYYKKALLLDENHIKALCDLHYAYVSIHQYDENIVNRTGELNSENKYVIDMIKGTQSLLRGDYLTGFHFNESRLKYFKKENVFPRWNGEDLHGKSILVRYDESVFSGFGDQLQFCRFVKTLKKFGAKKVGFYCSIQLHRLLKKVDGIDILVENLSDAEGYDFEVMMLSLPYYLKTTLNNIPNGQILSINEEDRRWKKILGNVSELKVGLAWKGHDTYEKDRLRSAGFETFRPLFDANCQFFSLQKGKGQDEIQEFPPPKILHDVMDHMMDFYDTACLVKELDLVITVDTSIAHLAAGMGKPVWLLSRYNGCWRWMLDREDSPWYPSIKIYRQESPKNWNSIMHKVSQDLIDKANS